MSSNSSNDFSTVHVIDDRLNFGKDSKVAYAVMTGAQSSVSTKFNATSQGNNSHTYTVQTPSLDTVLDRGIKIRSTVTFKVTGTLTGLGALLRPGISCCLSAFPLHEMMTTASCSINSNQVTSNISDIKSALSQMISRTNRNGYNTTTPVTPDGYYLNYGDATNAYNDVFAGYQTSGQMDNDNLSRGSFPVQVGRTPACVLTEPQVINGEGANVQTSYLKVTLEEPLLFLSPWSYASESNLTGIYGVQNLNFNFNFSTSGQCHPLRFREYPGWACPDIQVSVEKFEESMLICNFLSPQPTQVMNPRCITPFYETPRYITNFANIGAGNKSEQLQSSTISLNVIPDMLVVFVKPSVKTPYTSDWFLTIESISINFNNQSGLLSTASKAELFRTSVKNGLQANWLEFSGSAVGTPLNDNGVIKKVPTGGAPVFLKFASDIPLQSYLAPGSVGQFNLQLTITYTNQSNVEVVAPQLTIVTVNSGVFVTHEGSSSLYLGLLSREDVLTASQSQPIGHAQVRRLLGNGFLDKLKSFGSTAFKALKAVAPHALPLVRQYAEKSDNPKLQMLSKGLKMAGYGKGSAKHHKLM